jgi:sugar O-acyltransferase (sialic acid O-acetyltransferase NeuD family)
MKIVIIGAGGHAREVAEILRHQGQVEPGISVIGFIDENTQSCGEMHDGVPVLGDWSWFDEVDRNHIRVISAVGSPDACRHLVWRARELGLAFASAISPLAHVSPRAHLGEGVTLFPNVTVNTGAYIGDHCILNVGATVSHDAKVGEYTNVNPGARIAGNVTIGAGCYIGMGADIIHQVSVGADTIVGAGAAVVRDLGANVTAVGVPARVIKWKEQKERVDDELSISDPR